MFDPNERIMRPVPEDESTLTPNQRTWTRFEEGEELMVKGIKMRVHEIGESRMVLKFVVLILCALSVSARAQQSPVPPSNDKAKIAQLEAEVTNLQDQVAEKDIVISNLQMSLLQSQTGQVTATKQKAIADLQASHPGMRYDENSGKLVPIPAPPAPAKPEAPKK